MDALSATWLSSRLGVGSARIELMRRAGELLAVRQPGSQEYLYPGWQFDEHGRPRSVVRALVAAAGDAGLSRDQLLELLQRRSGLVGGGTLLDALLAGREDQVVEAVRSARAP